MQPMRSNTYTRSRNAAVQRDDIVCVSTLLKSNTFASLSAVKRFGEENI